MKMPLCLAGGLVAVVFAFLDGSRAGTLRGGSHRSGFGISSPGRSFGPAIRRERFGGRGPSAFRRTEGHPQAAILNRDRFFVRDRRFFFLHRGYPFSSVLYFGALGFPWWLPTDDGYLNDYPAQGSGAVYSSPEWDRSAAAEPSEPAQRGYDQNPVHVVITSGNARSVGSTDGGPNLSGGDGPTGSVAQPKNRFQQPSEPAAPRPDGPMLVYPSSPEAPAGVFGKLRLVSWFKDAGKETILVENTETKDVQEISSAPNKDNVRVVEIHPNVNPKLSEVVISNGKEQRAIKFRFDLPTTGNQPSATGAPDQTRAEQPPQNP